MLEMNVCTVMQPHVSISLSLCIILIHLNPKERPDLGFFECYIYGHVIVVAEWFRMWAACLHKGGRIIL